MRVPKVGPKAATKLFQAGYTLDRLASAVPEDIQQALRCTAKASKLLISAAQKILAEDVLPPLNAEEYQKVMDELQWTLKTGSKALNKLVGGGFDSFGTVASAGPQSTLKTQIGFEMIVEAQRQFPAEDDGYSIFVETELKTFSNRRLQQMAAARGIVYDPKKVLLVPSQRIREVGTQYYQYRRVNSLAKSMGIHPRVIVVDSLTALFKRKFVGRELLPNRSAELGRHLSFLEDMTKEHNSILYCTCQIIQSPVAPNEPGFTSSDVYTHFGTSYMVWGGHILRHTLGTWLSLDKYKADIWKVVLFDSSEMPRGSCLIRATARGIEDVPDRELT
jgi:DNA repair protein RadA